MAPTVLCAAVPHPMSPRQCSTRGTSTARHFNAMQQTLAKPMTSLDRVLKSMTKPMTASVVTSTRQLQGHSRLRPGPVATIQKAMASLTGARSLSTSHVGAGVVNNVSRLNTSGPMPTRILCYGDSLTAGYCRKGAFTPYGDVLASALKKSGVNAEISTCGLTGHTAGKMVAELDAAICTDGCGHRGHGLRYLLEMKGKQDFAIIMAGTNDMGDFRDANSIFRDIRQLHSVCHQRGIPTIAIAPPSPLKGAKQQLAMLLKRWAHAEPLVHAFIDAEDVLPRSNAQFWDRDGVHFSPAGSQRLGQNLCQHFLGSMGAAQVEDTWFGPGMLSSYVRLAGA